MSAKQERADRILDAAAELLAAHGYRKVTIDEVAERAQVGKGTVYLHWRSRDALLLAVLTREGAVLLDEFIAKARADHTVLLPHRYFGLILRRALERPLLRAMYTMDASRLGKLANSAGGKEVGSSKILAFEEYFQLLSDAGFIRAEWSARKWMYAVSGLIFGYTSIDSTLPPELDMSIDEKTEVFAHTIRTTFEPETPPARENLNEIATKLIEKFDELTMNYQRFIYQDKT